MCDDIWDDNDATVICKQLGYSRGSARVSAYFGEGSGLILLDNVNCGGSESSMFDCRHRKFGEHDCGHKEDAGVVCVGESSKGMYIYICNTFAPQIKGNCQCINVILHWLWNVNEIYAHLSVRIS